VGLGNHKLFLLFIFYIFVLSVYVSLPNSILYIVYGICDTAALGYEASCVGHSGQAERWQGSFDFVLVLIGFLDPSIMRAILRRPFCVCVCV
jgi:hypothetical protein